MTLTDTDQPASTPAPAPPRGRGVPPVLVFLGRRLAALVVVVWVWFHAVFFSVNGSMITSNGAANFQPLANHTFLDTPIGLTS